MAVALPPPEIPDLGPDNAIDLDQLGSADLETCIAYPGIAEGDQFWPQWWGCTASGDAVDDFNNLVDIGPGELTPEGMPVRISNDRLRELDQGWVFYSYSMYDPNMPDGRGEESLRRFFYVGKRSSTALLLPVPQLKESHDLAVDPALVGGAGATIVTLPYQAMSIDDKVTLTLERFFDEEGDDPWQPFERTKILTELDIGKPLEWTVPRNELLIIEDGSALMRYRIVYATPTVPSQSAEQTLRIVPPMSPFLPPLEIKGFTGDELDPEVFPDGITLTIKLYPGVQVGDDVVVYAAGDPRVIKTLRVDPSTIASNILEITLDYPWLSANNGKQITLMYQFARVGTAGTSQPLSLTLRKPLFLPPPFVECVKGDGEEGEYKGYLLAELITGGVWIKVPPEAVIGDDDKIQMHWKGYGNAYIADPSAGDAKRFYIPASAVPANMGKRLNVAYKVTPPGKESTNFDLEIKDMTRGWPIIQIKSPSSPSNRVSLAAAKNGVDFELADWKFMATGQRVKIYAVGVLSAGGQDTFNVRTGTSEVVTDAEYNTGLVKANLPLAFLQTLRLNVQFDVVVETSFDEGFSYKSFLSITPTLIS